MNGKMKGICAVALGLGILLALVLPVNIIIFCAGVSLILLGCTWIKRR